MSEEERLGSEALLRIRNWMEKRKACGEEDPPRLAIKFCGGCNPVVERGEIAGILRRGLCGGVHWTSPDEEADLLAIISGCLTACADRPEVKTKAANFLIVRADSVSFVQFSDSPTPV